MQHPLNKFSFSILSHLATGTAGHCGFHLPCLAWAKTWEQLNFYQGSSITKTNLLGLNGQYVESKIEQDDSEAFYNQTNYQTTVSNKQFFKPRVIVEKKKSDTTGFCIRTGKQTPFNPAKPMSAEAYESWAKFKNPNYPEKFCHKTGKVSNGKTSMRKPVME